MLTVNKSLAYLFLFTLIAGIITILVVEKTYSRQFEIAEYPVETEIQ